MSNSNLVDYTKISPNSNNPRKYKIDRITIHHLAGNVDIETACEIFANPEREGSANYIIGTDGRIALCVDEANRAWTSSNAENDNRAVTIEVANDGGDPDWHVSDAALESLIKLCVDICQRNGIERLNFTGDTSGNLTMHKWFAATLCPGRYLGGKFPYIAEEVNRRLGKEEETSKEDGTIYRIQLGAYRYRKYAERHLAELQAMGLEAFITESKTETKKVVRPGDSVVIKRGASAYDGTLLAGYLFDKVYYVQEVSGDRVVVAYGGVVIAAVKDDDLVVIDI